MGKYTNLDLRKKSRLKNSVAVNSITLIVINDRIQLKTVVYLLQCIWMEAPQTQDSFVHSIVDKNYRKQKNNVEFWILKRSNFCKIRSEINVRGNSWKSKID